MISKYCNYDFTHGFPRRFEMGQIPNSSPGLGGLQRFACNVLQYRFEHGFSGDTSMNAGNLRHYFAAKSSNRNRSSIFGHAADMRGSLDFAFLKLLYSLSMLRARRTQGKFRTE